MDWESLADALLKENARLEEELAHAEGEIRTLSALLEELFAKEEDKDEIAREFLRRVLAHGPRPLRDVAIEADRAEILWATLKRAMGEIGVKWWKDADSRIVMIRLPKI